jgi:phosphatidylserine/phosphatidylglycerophosphate/cardiolipin synthase-like enzyme
MAHEDGPRKILELGRNVWKTTQPEAAGVLVDAAAYYRAFYAAALGAKRSILLAGWQFDSGVPLLRGSDATPGTEVRLVRFLNELCERNPELEVHILAWDFHAIFALEREWMQTAYFEWATSERRRRKAHTIRNSWSSIALCRSSAASICVKRAGTIAATAPITRCG